MKLKIIMDSGKEYTIEGTKSMDSLMFNKFNGASILRNYLVDITDNISIIPSHISSVEKIEEK